MERLNKNQRKKIKRMVDILDAMNNVYSLVKPFITKGNHRKVSRMLINLENAINQGGV